MARRKLGVVQACLIPMASPGQLALRTQVQILFLLRRPAQLLPWAAWACEWDPTSPLTAELSRLSNSVCIYCGYPPHACTRLTQHSTPLFIFHNQHREASVSTQQLPTTGITSANNPLTSKSNPTHTTAKATPADIYPQQAMPHAQRNLEARRPPRWSGRQLFRRGACCFDFVIAWSC